MLTLKRERKELPVCDMKFASDAAGVFSGYGSIFGNVDSYGDVMQKGAFRDTLREWEEKGKYPPMLLQHGGGPFGGTAEDLLPIGVWTKMEENTKGLKVEGQLIALSTELGTRIYEGLKHGVLDGMSIGYSVKESVSGTKPGEPRRTLTSVDLWELSIVTFPANDKSRVSNVKAADLIDNMHSLSDAEEFLREAGMFSKSVSRDFVSKLVKIARREADDDQLTNLLASLRQARGSF